jgi:hypothetical protein
MNPHHPANHRLHQHRIDYRDGPLYTWILPRL